MSEDLVPSEPVCTGGTWHGLLFANPRTSPSGPLENAPSHCPNLVFWSERSRPIGMQIAVAECP